jgi:hypothetical protein
MGGSKTELRLTLTYYVLMSPVLPRLQQQYAVHFVVIEMVSLHHPDPDMLEHTLSEPPQCCMCHPAAPCTAATNSAGHASTARSCILSGAVGQGLCT